MTMTDAPQLESYVREPSYGGPGDAPALRDILLERQRQDAKFGEQNLDPMLYLTVLTEEVGEVAKAILDIRFGKDTLAHLREEAVQTAAVALAFVECLDRGKWKDAGGEPVTEVPPSTTAEMAERELRGLLRRAAASGLRVSFNPDRGGSMYSDHDTWLTEKHLDDRALMVELPKPQGTPAHSAPPTEKKRPVVGDRVRAVAGFHEGAVGTVKRSVLAADETYEVDCGDGARIVTQAQYLEVLDDVPMEGVNRPTGLPTGDARTPDSAKTAQCLATWHTGNPARQTEPVKRHVSPGVRVRVKGGLFARKTGTAVRWNDAYHNDWRVRIDEEGEAIFKSDNLEVLDDKDEDPVLQGELGWPSTANPNTGAPC
jgi:NTP pyrophosphatase (non-canonical NTP hydrolase)